MRRGNIWSWIREICTEAARGFGTVVAWCVIGTFIAVTAISILWKLHTPPVQGLDSAAAALPSRFYSDLISMEIPNLAAEAEDSSFSTKNVASFLTKLTTGIDPNDPRTLTAQLLPGAPNDGSIILIPGIGTGPADYPVEVPPAPHLQELVVIPLPEGYGDTAGGDPPEETLPDGEETASGPDAPVEPVSPEDTDPGAEPEEKPEPVPNVVFIYHSHPTESYLPELDGITKIDEAYHQEDKDKTVAAVGARLSEALISRGIGSVHSDLYYPWRGAYDESRKTVKAAMQQHEELTYFIDIHRDAARKEKTRLVHDGVAYAKLYFVVGQKNPNYEKNQALAEELHYRIEEKVQGISRGVVGKKTGSNGEFNQSLSPGSILIEFGGVDNTLEEAYRTAEVLAEVIAEMYWEQSDAVKANTKPEERTTEMIEASAGK